MDRQIERAIEALKIYDGQKVILTLGVSGNNLMHYTCRGYMDISPSGWVTVRRHAVSWAQEIAFNPEEVMVFNITLGTEEPRIGITMPDPEGKADEHH